MTKTKTSSRSCRPYPSRKLGWPLTTTLVLRVITLATLATIAHAVIDDACRGTCDRYPDRYCEGSWISSCDRCLRSTKNTKCIEYFKTVKTTTPESPTPFQDPSRPTSPRATPPRPTTNSSERLTKEEDPNPRSFRNQTDTLSLNLTISNQSHNDTKQNNGGVLKDSDSDVTALGEGDSSGASVLIVPLLGVLVVITVGGVCVCRKLPPPNMPEVGEAPQDANEEEIEDLVIKMSTEEEGPVGGPSLMPNGQHVFLQNEVIGNNKGAWV